MVVQMTSKATQFRAQLLHPRHWLLWLAFGLWRMISLLPYGVLLQLGKGIGLLVHSFPSRRKTIALRNIQLCFPNLRDQEHRAMLRSNLINVGTALMEVGIAWCGRKTL